MKEVIYKLPQEFIHKLKKLYPTKYNNILNTFTQKSPTTFRVNYLKTDLVGLRRMLVAQRIKFQELSYPKGSFILKGNIRDLQKTDVYNQGFIFVQNISSMLPPLILDPKDDEHILDLCAAPGAKTTQIVSLAPNVDLVAVEKVRVRFYKLLANLKAQGVDSVKTMLLDATLVRKKFPESFDKILADVPCSAEGRFLVSNPRTFKYWKLRKVKEMAHKQKKLISAAFYALKEQGQMVYSTCTFSPEENEMIIDRFLNKFKEKVELMPVNIKGHNVQNAITRWKGKKFSNDLSMAKRILPNDYMEGFFIAKIKKISY